MLHREHLSVIMNDVRNSLCVRSRSEHIMNFVACWNSHKLKAYPERQQ